MITACPRSGLPRRPRVEEMMRIRRGLDVRLKMMEAPFHPSMFDKICAGCGSPYRTPHIVITATGAALVCDECHETRAT